MPYRIARYTDDTTIEPHPRKFFWRLSAAIAAKELNAAMPRPGGLAGALRAMAGYPTRWEVYSVKALTYAHTLAEERAETDRDWKGVEFIKSLKTVRPSVLDDVQHGHPETVPARSLPWLDEDATSGEGLRYAEPEDTDDSHDAVRPASYEVPEDHWDWANGGPLGGGKGIGCFPPLVDELPVRIPDAELPDPAADLPWEEAAKSWAGVTFLPVADTLLNRAENAAADTLDIPLPPVSLSEDDDERASAELEKRFQESPVSAQVEAFLADPSVGAMIKRSARKRPARQTSIVDNDQDA